jgi:hypothetical protein
MQRSFHVTVREVNAAPSINDVATQTISAGANYAFTLTAFDPDLPVQTLSYVFDSAPPAGMTIDATGTIHWQPLDSQVGAHSVTVRITDDGSPVLSATRTIDFQVTGGAPTAILLGSTTVAEITPGAIVGSITVSDPTPGDVHTFTIDDPRFEIAAGQLKLKPAQMLDFETEPTVHLSITAMDTSGLSKTETFTLTVLNVNEAPTSIQLVAGTVLENSPGAVIGTLSATDPEPGDAHTFTTTDSRFEIVGDQLKLKPGQSVNYEAGAIVTVSITATDNGSPARSFTQTVSFNVTDVNEPPTDLDLSRKKAFADIAGAWIAQIVVTDPERSAFNFTVSDPRFTVTSGHLYLKAVQKLNLATEPTVTLQITATDAVLPLQTLTKAFVLTVENSPAVWNFAHQWAPRPLDVNIDGLITPLDALLIINQLNAVGPGNLPIQLGGTAAPLFFDTSGDNALGPLDALLVINYLNSGAGGESEVSANGDASLIDLAFSDENESWSLWEAAVWDELNAKEKRAVQQMDVR